VPNNVVVEIADTGIGIPTEDLPHIYDRYYRSQQARSLERGGTGLGLPIAKKIIDMHLGEISVTSALGQGTTFRIQIPLNGS
jgi:two-component system sensor histidine kinase BaeS